MDFTEAEKLNRSLIDLLYSDRIVEQESGWRLVYKSHYIMVRELVRNNHGSEDDAHDVFQEGAAILHANIRNGKFKKESTISTYLYSICRNIWLRKLREREKERITISEMIEDLKTDENKFLIDVEVVSVLLSELGDECRQILLEFYFNSRSVEELKTIFNVKSAQVAKNKKYRCLAHLKKLFIVRSIIPYHDK